MNSKNKKLSRNVSLGSKASAQMKLILTLAILGIASALLVGGVLAATFTTVIEKPAMDGAYFSTNLPFINASTGAVTTDCNYEIKNDSTQIGPNVLGTSATTHEVSDVDISTLADGAYSISVYCENSADNTDNETILRTFFKDTVDPIITWNNPLNLSYVTGNITLNVTVVDTDPGVNAPSGFQTSCGGSLDGPYLTNVDSTTNYLYAYWNASGASEGTCSFNVTVFDTAGNSDFNDSLSATVDNTEPILNIIAPSNESLFTSANVYFNYSFIDALSSTADCDIVVMNSSMDDVEQFFNNSLANNTGIDSTFTISDGEGIYYWNVVCADLAGNENGTDDYTFTIDSTPPTTTATAENEDTTPYTFGYITNQSVNVTLTCDDGAEGSGCSVTHYCIHTGADCTPSTAYTNEIEITSEGYHYLKYNSTDNAGNTETTKIKDPVVLDLTAPAITFDVVGPVVYDEIQWINFTTSDFSGINASDLEQYYSTTCNTDNWVGGFTCNNTGLIDVVECGRQYNFSAVANGVSCAFNVTNLEDIAGNVASDSIEVLVHPSCGDNIYRSETLTQNIGVCDGTGLTIFAHNVVLDCDNFNITGDNGATQSFGIKLADSVDNATIVNCHIYGYGGTEDAGIRMYSNHDNTVIANSSIHDAAIGILRTNVSGVANSDNNTLISGIDIIGTTVGAGISFDNATDLMIEETWIMDTTGPGVSVSDAGNNVNLFMNVINNSGEDGIFLKQTTGSITFSEITYSAEYGVFLFESGVFVDNNTIAYSSDNGIYIFANGPVPEITNNTIYENNNGVYIQSSMGALVYHNNIYDNTLKNVVSHNAIELSNGSEGNYWGHSVCPVFEPNVDSNAINVIDSHPFENESGWLNAEAPTYCVTLDSFTDNQLNAETYLNYEDCYVNYATDCSVTLLANVTNSSEAGVNITHNGVLSGEDPYPMGAGVVPEADFWLAPHFSLGGLPGTNGSVNITAGAFLYIAPSYKDERNYTIYYDFERPKVNFAWWSTKDEQGEDIILPDYRDFLNESDIFFSPTDNVVYFKVNATDNVEIDDVYVEFTKDFEGSNQKGPVDELMLSTGGDCNGTIFLEFDSGFYIGNCSLGTFDEETIMAWNEQYGNPGESGPVLSFNAEVYAEDKFGNINVPYNVTEAPGTECVFFGEPTPEEMEQCMPALSPILMHDIGVMGAISVDDVHEQIEDWYDCTWGVDCDEEMCLPGEDPEVEDCWEADEVCFYMDDLVTTNFNNEFDFSNVDFSVGMKVNLSCLAETGEIDTDYTMPDTYETMMILNLTGLDFNSQETAMRLAMLPDAIEVLINMPGDFGESYIYVDSDAFAELDTAATINFFHLPFASEPEIDWTDAAGVASQTWVQDLADPFWSGIPSGNLTIDVDGFSGYEVLDQDLPTITIDAPADGLTTGETEIQVDITFNGTGTQMSNMLLYLGSTLKYNYSADQSACSNVTDGSEEWICNITLNGLTHGTNNITVMGFDFGGGQAPGLNATDSIILNVDTTPPTIEGIYSSYVDNESARISATTNENATCFVEYGLDTLYGTASAPNYTDGEFDIDLIGLSAGTLYHYRWNCTDNYTNSAVSEDYTFITGIVETYVNTTPIIINFTEDGTPMLELNISGDGTTMITLATNDTGTVPTGLLSAEVYLTIENDSELNITKMIIKAYYNKSNLPANMDESTLRLYYFNETSGLWEELPGGVNTTATPPYVWGEVDHFSEYAIFGSATPSSSSSSGSTPIGGTTGATYQWTENNFTKAMYLYDKVTFSMDGENHQIELNSLTSDFIVLRISSEPFTVTMAAGTTKDIDVDLDGTFDITVYLEKIETAKAYLTFSKITEQVQPPVIVDEDDETPVIPIEQPVETETTTTNVPQWLVIAIVAIVGVGVIYWMTTRKK